MDVTARFAIVPLCFVSLVTGVIESLGTTWVCFATIGCGEAGHHRRFDRLRGLTAYGRRKEREAEAESLRRSSPADASMPRWVYASWSVVIFLFLLFVLHLSGHGSDVKGNERRPIGTRASNDYRAGNVLR